MAFQLLSKVAIILRPIQNSCIEIDIGCTSVCLNLSILACYFMPMAKKPTGFTRSKTAIYISASMASYLPSCTGYPVGAFECMERQNGAHAEHSTLTIPCRARKGGAKTAPFPKADEQGFDLRTQTS